MKKTQLRRGDLRRRPKENEEPTLAAGSGMDERAEEILFSIASPEANDNGSATDPLREENATNQNPGAE